jgi:hypothetical protein
MSKSKIIGRDGRLVWDNFPVALKYWMIEWDKPDEGFESWHGKAILSQTDLRAMMEEHAKFGPIPITEPILAEFRKGKEVYSGRFLIASFPDAIDSNPVINFTGTGELKPHEH